MARCIPWLAFLVFGCGEPPATVSDAWAGSADAERPIADAGRAPRDGGRVVADPDGGPPPDASAPIGSLGAERDRLFGTWTDEPCDQWSSMDESSRAVFLTITHRLHLSRTPDGRTALSHLERLYAVLGGGADGTECGGGENNRVFASMDQYLWQRMLEANEGMLGTTDGGDGYWAVSRDIAGPHDPFDASNETESGLDCVLVVETGDSRPPTGQAHFFRDGSARPISRGPVEIDADQRALEVDLDFDCFHQSNPTCRDFESRYREGYGDFDCGWVPSSCEAAGDSCYRDVAAR